MAVANTKSTQITNADATAPSALNPAHVTQGMLRESIATIEVAAADDDNSVYRLVRVRSSDRLSQITVFNDAIAAGVAFDCGLYDPAGDGGAVVSQYLFAQAADMSAGSTLGTEMLHFTNDIANVGKMIWELLALPKDSQKFYDICLTATTVGSGAGTLSMRVRYVPGV
jgi:hypothetical protein